MKKNSIVNHLRVFFLLRFFDRGNLPVIAMAMVDPLVLRHIETPGYNETQGNQSSLNFFLKFCVNDLQTLNEKLGQFSCVK